MQKTEKPCQKNISTKSLKSYLNSGFEGHVSVNEKVTKFTGIDKTVPAPNNWDNIPGDVSFRFLIAHDGRGGIGITNDPREPKNHVAYFEILESGEKKGRAQGSFILNRKYDYNAIYWRSRIYIPHDWKVIESNTPPYGWAGFLKLWTKTLPREKLEGDDIAYDGAGSFRMGFSFEISEEENHFVWVCHGQDRTYASSETNKGWKRSNKKSPIPFGEWATFEYYISKGPDPKIHPDSSARFLVRMKVDGGDWVTLFDICDELTEHSTHPVPGYRAFQPFKNYVSKRYIDHLFSEGKRVYFLYDDIHLWLGE
jgi:hypothetical protein